MNIVSRPWRPQDLIDDLQMLIDEEPDLYLNGRRTTLCMARDFLKDYFALGDCIGCRWRGVRPQKCSCCARNLDMKDNYKEDT